MVYASDYGMSSYGYAQFYIRSGSGNIFGHLNNGETVTVTFGVSYSVYDSWDNTYRYSEYLNEVIRLELADTVPPTIKATNTNTNWTQSGAIKITVTDNKGGANC